MNSVKKIFIIGIGKLGASIAKELSCKGEDVVCVDKQAEAFNKLDDFCGFTQVGDALDLAFLEQIDIKSSKAVIITTNDDDVNIFLAHECFFLLSIKNIYIRLWDTDKSKLIQYTSIDAIYPFNLSLDKLREKLK